MRFGGEVHHGVGLGHQPVDQGFIGDIALDDADAVAEGVQRLAAAGVGQGIEHGDGGLGVITRGAVDEIRPDEARATGDQEPH